MDIRERVKGRVRLLDLSGRFVLGDGDGLLKETITGLTGAGHRQIVLNLAGVLYLDSCGVGELVASYTTVVRQGGQLKLVNLTRRVSELLTTAKLLTVFEVCDSEADALDEFRSKSNERARVTAGRPIGVSGFALHAEYNPPPWR